MIITNLIPLELDPDLPKWIEYLDTLPWVKGHLDESGHKAFLRACSLNVPKERAIEEVALRCRNAGDIPSASKLNHQYNSAVRHVNMTSLGQDIVLLNFTPVFDLHALQRVATKASEVNEDWLVGHSPMNVGEATAATFLESVYQPGEKVIVFTDFKSQGQAVFEVGKSAPTDLPTEGPDGVWYLTNPVDGCEHLNEDGNSSRRSKEAVTSWRYLVLECDLEGKIPGVNPLWLSALVQLPLKIAAIYTSGGKSIHALVRLDASSKEEWDSMRDKIRAILVQLGADPSAMTAVRLSRLPQTMRGSSPQKLLYLAPNPDEVPIFRRDS